MTAVLDDASGLPYAAGKKDITETWEVCAGTFLFFSFLDLQCFVITAVQSELSNNIQSRRFVYSIRCS